VTPDPSLSYLFAYPEALSVTLQRPAALALVLLLPLAVLLAPPGLRHQRVVLGLRLSALALLILALAGLALSTRLPSDRLSLVAVVDLSESIDADGRAWQVRSLEQVAASLAPNDELGIVAFGTDAVVVVPPSVHREIDLRAVTLSATATDIGRALDTAFALFPADAERRLLLLSDGNETRGSALARIARARRSGVHIFAATPPRAGGPDVAVEKLAVAPVVSEGRVFPVRVTVRNNGKGREARLAFLVDGKEIGEETVRLQPGLNAIEIPYRMTGAGSHRLRAKVSALGDTIAANNYREVAIMVGGKSRALLVTSNPRSALATALERKEVAVTRIVPGQMPARIEDLLSYHCIIFEDVEAKAFAPRVLESVERYVMDFGGGLLVAAGERTFGDMNFRKTAVQRLLPVTLEPRRPPRAEREPLALFLLIDRSNSMGYHISNRTQRSDTESKLTYAKRAALAVIEQLKDSDLAGVVVFDSQAFEIAPLRPLREGRAVLQRDIPRLQPGGGTDFYDAMQMALTQLTESRVRTQHIILLTDGDTNRAASDHYPLIAALERLGVSVTTIRIGDDTVNLAFLSDISSRTGGVFYHVENVERLPELMLKDTSRALAQAPRRDQTFAVRTAGNSQILRGLGARELPDLSGYAYTRPKPDADVLLYVPGTDKRDPLLAAWQYGLGRVASFTASLSDDAETWVGWDGFGKLWSQVVQWVVREQTPWDYALDVRRVDGQNQLNVRIFSDLEDGALVARLLADTDRYVDVPLVPRGPRELTAQLPALPGGLYPLTLMQRSGGRLLTQRTELVSVPDRDEEPQEEFDADQPNLALLERLTGETGGAVGAPIRTIVGREAGTRQVDYPLEWLLVPAAMLVFLTEVGWRRLRLTTPR
jgi:Ca-activated chloride channel family protein